MVEKSEIQKLKSEYPEFFSQFSPEFLEFVFSEETASGISEICLENGLEDEEVAEKIAYRVALVLLNQMPKENLAKTLEKEVGLNPIIAEKISFDIEKHVFSQIPGKIEKIEKPPHPIQKDDYREIPAKIEEPVKGDNHLGLERTEDLPKKDTYRELIE